MVRHGIFLAFKYKVECIEGIPLEVNLIGTVEKQKGVSMKAAIYARVSTHDKGQDPDLQLKPLRDYCRQRGFEVADEFVDVGISGSKDRRPELDKLMDLAKKRLIDCVIVWKLDRFGRSLKHLVTALDEFEKLGVSFISYRENLDLTSSTGKLMFHIIAAMAEFERALIVERVKAGIVNARAKGRRVGRKPIDVSTTEKIFELRNQNLPLRKISEQLKISKSLVHKTLKNFESKTTEKQVF